MIQPENMNTLKSEQQRIGCSSIEGSFGGGFAATTEDRRRPVQQIMQPRSLSLSRHNPRVPSNPAKRKQFFLSNVQLQRQEVRQQFKEFQKDKLIQQYLKTGKGRLKETALVSTVGGSVEALTSVYAKDKVSEYESKETLSLTPISISPRKM